MKQSLASARQGRTEADRTRYVLGLGQAILDKVDGFPCPFHGQAMLISSRQTAHRIGDLNVESRSYGLPRSKCSGPKAALPSAMIRPNAAFT